MKSMRCRADMLRRMLYEPCTRQKRKCISGLPAVPVSVVVLGKKNLATALRMRSWEMILRENALVFRGAEVAYDGTFVNGPGSIGPPVVALTS